MDLDERKSKIHVNYKALLVILLISIAVYYRNEIYTLLHLDVLTIRYVLIAFVGLSLIIYLISIGSDNLWITGLTILAVGCICCFIAYPEWKTAPYGEFEYYETTVVNKYTLTGMLDSELPVRKASVAAVLATEHPQSRLHCFVECVNPNDPLGHNLVFKVNSHIYANTETGQHVKIVVTRIHGKTEKVQLIGNEGPTGELW